MLSISDISSKLSFAILKMAVVNKMLLIALNIALLYESGYLIVHKYLNGTQRNRLIIRHKLLLQQFENGAHIWDFAFLCA